MCGICGIFSLEKIDKSDIELVDKMNHVQSPRGPDDAGLFLDDYCVLGHRRLSIIDLSASGHQPFHSEDGRFHITYNGEIYNYIELRQELINKGFSFRTKTDTEVLLKAFIAFGEKCLEMFNGMFAFTIYDSSRNTLFMARDRVGVKPFYYFYKNQKLFFASEIKALKQINSGTFSINKFAIFDYLCFNRTDIFEETFNNEIKRLPKGHFATLDKNGLRIKQWWDPRTFIQVKNDSALPDITKKIEEIMISSVMLRMRSDVPVGSCLSGGLDSSIITGILYTYCKPENYKTFTVSFPGSKFDETKYVDLLNKKYPFTNFRTYPTAEDAYNKLKEFVYINDEPTTSPTFFSQYEVMRLAKERGVTVLLDGQGGDENFAGYQYFHGFNFTGLYHQRKFGRLLLELYKSFTRNQDKEAFQTFLFQILPGFMKKKLLFNTLPHIRKDFFYDYVDNSRIYNEFFTADNLNESLVRHFQYKLEHLLRMEDRNSMAHQIEARVPYLDYRLIEYVLSISEELKMKKGETKILQKHSLGQYTIPEILNRKDKIGFGTPGEEWMKTDYWTRLTEQNFSFLCEQLPDVFQKNSKLVDNLYEKWKINQLATWLQIN